MSDDADQLRFGISSSTRSAALSHRSGAASGRHVTESPKRKGFVKLCWPILSYFPFGGVGFEILRGLRRPVWFGLA